MGQTDDNFYRHMRVYTICVSNGRILVIQKVLGPYIGRYDLPGGRLERGETLEQAVMREFQEETGYCIKNIYQAVQIEIVRSIIENHLDDFGLFADAVKKKLRGV